MTLAEQIAKIIRDNVVDHSRACELDGYSCLDLHNPINEMTIIDGVIKSVFADVDVLAGAIASGLEHTLALKAAGDETEKCICWDGNPENFEGARRDCPKHGLWPTLRQARSEIGVYKAAFDVIKETILAVEKSTP